MVEKRRDLERTEKEIQVGNNASALGNGTLGLTQSSFHIVNEKLLGRCIN